MKHNIHAIKKHLLAAALLGAGCGFSNAAVLFTHAGQLVNDANVSLTPGISRDDTATDTLYFRFTVTNPASNIGTESYYAGFQLYQSGVERLAIGNAWDFWAYSAFSTGIADLDIRSANPDGTNLSGVPYQLVESSDTTTIVFRVAYNSAANDSITVWMNPNLSLSEGAQSSTWTTNFSANASFNDIVLREGDDGVGSVAGGWNFSDIGVATTFAEIAAIPEPSAALLGSLGVLALLRRRK